MRSFRNPKTTAAAIVLAVSIPYSALCRRLQAVLFLEACSQVVTSCVQDAGCSWLAHEANVEGPILARDPGEVYWLSGRQAIPPGNKESEIHQLLEEFRVAYLLIDDGRYANAPLNPLTRFVEEEPSRVRRVWSRTSGGSSIRIFQVLHAEERTSDGQIDSAACVISERLIAVGHRPRWWPP